jgi:hypothetical protein
MVTSDTFAEFLREQLAPLGRVTAPTAPSTAALRSLMVAEAETVRASSMFSPLTSRTNSGCAAWWSKVVSTKRRTASAGGRSSRRSAPSASRIPP